MRLPRSSTSARTTRTLFCTKRLKNGLFVRLVFITRDQSRRLVFQAFRCQTQQQLGVPFRPFAIDHLQHKFVFGIHCDTIPVVAATSVRRMTFIAVFFLLVHEVPLFVELNLFGLWGKKPRVRRGVARRVRLPILYNGRRYWDQPSLNGWSFAYHCLRRRVR